ncbi:MAG TPA: nucleotidyltransferase family protein [Thermoleophilaceae bacterium]|nr:nucleotidyltransferase family protein [Thermoleophilaceae bacterium]
MRRATLTLAADAAAAELLPALEAIGVPSLILRGPAIAHWAYPDAQRHYSDLDLLIPAAHEPRAAAVLRELGYEDVRAHLSARELADLRLHGHVGTHATTWRRDGMVVDLHRTLNHIRAGSTKVWAELCAGAVMIEVGGRQVAVPGQAATALIVALHAAAHGSGYRRTLRDLEQALNHVPREAWSEAAEMAGRLRALGEFSAGLALLPEGLELAREMELDSAPSVETTLRARNAPLTAIGFERLWRTRGKRAKLGLIRREIMPPPAFMRVRFPVARRGRVGMAAAYVWRPFSLLVHGGAGFVAWRRERGRRR